MHTLAAGHVASLDADQVKNLGMGGIIVIALIGLVIAYVVSKVVVKVIVIAIVVVLCVAFYNQRSKVVDAIDKQAKKCDVTFFGIHVQPSNPTVKQACAQIGSTHK